jgi:hypothetical protein
MMLDMPSIAHEAPLELLRGDPRLAAVLLKSLSVTIPPGATAQLVPADLTASLPAEFRADAVVLLSGITGRLAVIVEVQLSYDTGKEYSWPAYLTQVRAAHRCPAVLLVICADPATAARCRTPITTGHPGFDLNALVVDAVTTPRPGSAGTEAGPELTVLAVLTGALDLDQDSARRLVLASLASADESKRKSYTVFVLNAASAAAQQALEDLMATTQFSHPFIERYIAEGKAEGLTEGEARGEARMVLRILAARGLQVPTEVRDRVLSCSDTAQLEAWGDRAATAASVEEVFGS